MEYVGRQNRFRVVLEYDESDVIENALLSGTREEKSWL
jgi:hypothetical protein